MYTFIAVAALFALAVLYSYEQVQKGRRNMDVFEPYEIGDMTPKKGDKLVCTESYGDFTQGFNYVVRVEYGGALVVINDEGKYVLAAGLDPRKFKVEEENVDGTFAGNVRRDED